MPVKNKGGQKPWATSAQQAWLSDKLDTFQAFRNTPLAKDFWNTLFEDWFEEWPLEAPEGSVKDLRHKKKQQIKDWLKNHSKSVAPSAGKPKLLDLQRRKAKRLPIWQAYSKLYYDTKLRDVVDDLWMHKYQKENPDAGDNDVPPPIPIAWRNETIAILFEEESDEVKKECKKFAEKTELPIEALPEGMETDDPIERKRRVEAFGYGRAIKSLDITMMTLLKDVTRQTGLIGAILLAGPNPNKGGSLTLFEYHFDRADGGPGFPDYEGYQDLRTSFHDFACTVFPPKLRWHRAIPGTEAEANYLHKIQEDSESIAERPRRNKKQPARYMSVHTSDDSDEQMTRTGKKGKGRGKQCVKETVESSDQIDSSDDEGKWSSDSAESTSGLGNRELATKIKIAYDNLAKFTAQRPSTSHKTANIGKKGKRDQEQNGTPRVQADDDHGLRYANQGNRSSETPPGNPRPRQSSNLVNDGPLEVLVVDNTSNGGSHKTLPVGNMPDGELHQAFSVIGNASNKPSEASQVKNMPDGEPHEALSVISNASNEPPEASLINNTHDDGPHEARLVINIANDEPSETSQISNTPDGGSHEALPVINYMNDEPPETSLVNNTPNAGPHEALPVIDNVNDGPLEALPVKNMLVDDNVNNPSEPLLDIRSMLTEIADIKWPPWLEKNLQRLWDVSGLEEYHDVVRNIAVLDMLLGFPTGQNKAVMVSKANRPDAINRWITAGRKSFPALELTSFVPSWKKWWISLQPASRIGKRNTFIYEVNADEPWEELIKGSVNGFFTVVVGLGMWATALKTPAQEKSFAEMVKDVAWVQDQIIGKLKRANKHTRTEDENENELRRGKRARK